MNIVKQANVALCLELHRSLREGGGTPVEADADLNRASVVLVHAMHEAHGQAWLGKVNDKGAEAPRIRRWVENEPIYCFGADFVLPAHDLELERLLLERDEAPWTAREDYARIQVITERIRAVGGQNLVWS